jgi:hypothetical protein
MRKGEELKAPRHASAAATRDGSLPYVTANCLIPDTSNSSFIVALYIQILLNYCNKYRSFLLTIAIII